MLYLTSSRVMKTTLKSSSPSPSPALVTHSMQLLQQTMKQTNLPCFPCLPRLHKRQYLLPILDPVRVPLQIPNNSCL
ncbi:hypothetical protein VTJ04DRAFT_1771 [Mycothermus thermophilus]|uniref:uncharacterized protein n=1 Tax=Humicola insolens TaxID=85995 RepID=UPI00374438B1